MWSYECFIFWKAILYSYFHGWLFKACMGTSFKERIWSFVCFKTSLFSTKRSFSNYEKLYVHWAITTSMLMGSKLERGRLSQLARSNTRGLCHTARGGKSPKGGRSWSALLLAAHQRETGSFESQVRPVVWEPKLPSRPIVYHTNHAENEWAQSQKSRTVSVREIARPSDTLQQCAN